MREMIIEHRERLSRFPTVEYGYYALIVPDHAAGSRNRYTVYLIPPSPGIARRIKIIGRELDLKTARMVAKRETRRIRARFSP